MAGLFMLRAVLNSMVRYWIETGKITRNPMLSLIFKKVGKDIGIRGVCFLECDQVPLDREMDNPFNNPYLPRSKDIWKFLFNCGTQPKSLIAISCNIAAFLIFVLMNEFEVKWDPDYTQDVYIYNGDQYLESMCQRSTLWAKRGRMNNASIMIMRSLIPKI